MKKIEITTEFIKLDQLLKFAGLVMTGGGALLHGLDRLISENTKLPVTIAPNPTECVAKGTAASFEYADRLFDGFIKNSAYLK